MTKIKYLSRSRLYPAFGSSDIKRNIIYVRNDLPKSVKKFVKEHELYHLIDKSRFWLWREIKANIYGAVKHPFGFLLCIIMSLSSYRLKFYFKRFKTGK